MARVPVLWTRPCHVSAEEAPAWAQHEASRPLSLEGVAYAQLTALQSACERHARAWDWMLELRFASGVSSNASAEAAPWTERLADLRVLGLRPTVLLADGGIALRAEAR
jgi:hypothetical protein